MTSMKSEAVPPSRIGATGKKNSRGGLTGTDLMVESGLMGNTISKLSNASAFPGNPDPTIVIKKGDPEWDEAYQNWISGKNPTNSVEWKKGVFGSFDKDT